MNQYRVRGSKHPSAKLDEHDVRLIRALHREGLGYYPIARKFEVHPRTVQDVVRRHTWRHLE